MHPEVEVIFFIFLIIAALISLNVKNLLVAVVTLTVFSFVSALLYVAMGAVDVGFTEAVVGAGVTGVFFVVLIFKTGRKSAEKKPRFQTGNYVVLVIFCGLLIFGSLSLPNRGDLQSNLNRETSPAGTSNAGVHYIKHAYKDAHTPNMVTVTLADYRGYDTLWETAVIFTAALVCFLLLRRTRLQPMMDPADKKEESAAGAA
ncbi:MAG: DUF4040 domain-containing protein [Candidatus Aminicenantes bacterium]|nr:DUF4040 domain-containing protein [Candidatus Aminicenantes bacterium]